MIQSAEYLCLYAGMVLFALGIVTLFIKQSWRLGIVFILMADIPLAIAVAFPKILANTFDSMGISFDNSFAKITGSSIAIATFVILFYLYHKFFKYLFYKKAVAKEDKADENNDKDIKAQTSDTRSEPLSAKTADPAIFANVRYKQD